MFINKHKLTRALYMQHVYMLQNQPTGQIIIKVFAQLL